MMSREEFISLTPKQRGYAVYMVGCREDEPNVLDEKNPYQVGSEDHQDWNEGARIGAIQSQESDD